MQQSRPTALRYERLYLGTGSFLTNGGKCYGIQLERPDGKSISPKEYADLVEQLGYDRPNWDDIDYYQNIPAWQDQERYPRRGAL